MANPARIPDPSNDPRLNDPLNPVPPASSDPFAQEARRPANDPRVVNRVENRSGGSSVLIAAIVLVLAVIAYFVFAPGSRDATVPAEPATTTTQPTAPDAMTPAAPDAPEAVAPAAPADPVAPATDAVTPAPAETAPAPATSEPAPAQ